VLDCLPQRLQDADGGLQAVVPSRSHRGHHFASEEKGEISQGDAPGCGE
jgi:hypothetical protein